MRNRVVEHDVDRQPFEARDGETGDCTDDRSRGDDLARSTDERSQLFATAHRRPTATISVSIVPVDITKFLPSLRPGPHLDDENFWDLV